MYLYFLHSNSQAYCWLKGIIFLLDGFYSWLLADAEAKNICVEEMVKITDKGVD